MLDGMHHVYQLVRDLPNGATAISNDHEWPRVT